MITTQRFYDIGTPERLEAIEEFLGAMIITRTPFRISFAGGGSDLEAYYHARTRAVLSTAIDKYMYIAVKEHFEQTTFVSAIRRPRLWIAWTRSSTALYGNRWACWA